MGFKSNSMKRLIPFIPIIGIFLILYSTEQYVSIEDSIHFNLSALFQAAYIIVLLFIIGVI